MDNGKQMGMGWLLPGGGLEGRYSVPKSYVSSRTLLLAHFTLHFVMSWLLLLLLLLLLLSGEHREKRGPARPLTDEQELFVLVSRVGKGLAWVLGRLDGMVWEGPGYATPLERPYLAMLCAREILILLHTALASQPVVSQSVSQWQTEHTD